jgi:hypothetical protein
LAWSWRVAADGNLDQSLVDDWGRRDAFSHLG